jgi:hypothetical protein
MGPRLVIFKLAVLLLLYFRSLPVQTSDFDSDVLCQMSIDKCFLFSQLVPTTVSDTLKTSTVFPTSAFLPRATNCKSRTNYILRCALVALVYPGHFLWL